MTMPIDRLLSALEAKTGYRPRRSGKKWRVPCPVCGTPTLKGAVAEGDNGTVLARWFCGHSNHEVLALLDLTLADLFVHRDLRSLTRDERASLREGARHAQWRAALTTLLPEVSVVLIAAIQLGDGIALSDEDMQRLKVAALRVFDAGEFFDV